DERDGGADLTRGAVAALEGIMLDERLLQGVQGVSFCKSLDGDNPRPLLHDRKREAGIDAPPVDQHGAGAALAVVAAFFGSGEIEMKTQRIEQRSPWRNVELALHAVDVKRDGHPARDRNCLRWSASCRGALCHHEPPDVSAAARIEAPAGCE